MSLCSTQMARAWAEPVRTGHRVSQHQPGEVVKQGLLTLCPTVWAWSLAGTGGLPFMAPSQHESFCWWKGH